LDAPKLETAEQQLPVVFKPGVLINAMINISVIIHARVITTLDHICCFCAPRPGTLVVIWASYHPAAEGRRTTWASPSEKKNAPTRRNQDADGVF
jgi:hypothetical protein